MTQTELAKLETLLLQAFTKAIKQVGMGTFKATSMFASNESVGASLKKAA